MKHFIIISIILCNSLLVSIFSQENKNKTLVQIETSYGNLLVWLYDETPLHRYNMIKLAKEGYYENQIFHRVISDFMLQGGDPHSVEAKKGQRLGTGGPGYTIEAEFNPSLIHKKGAIAAARTGDNVNPEKRSSGSQFYIVQGRVLTIDELMILEQRNMHTPFTEEEVEAYTTIGGTPHLDGSYTVFGEVVEGIDLIDTICSVATDPYNRPDEDIVFNITVIDQ